MVSEPYLRTLVQVANERFETNAQRTERFRQAFRAQVDKQRSLANGSGGGGKARGFAQGDVRKDGRREPGSRTEGKRGTSNDEDEEADDSYALDLLLGSPG